MPDIVPLEEVPTSAVEALLDKAFGRDRHARTAYRIRGDALCIAPLSFAAVESGELVGSIQCWPIELARDGGDGVPLVMVGPVAVDPDRQNGGLGRQLMARMLAAAAAEELDGAMMLIGDPEYYGRFFGFTAEATAGWRLPGPVERHRLLARGTRITSATGLLVARRVLAA